MNLDTKFYEDIGKLKSDIDNVSTSVNRLCDVVDKLSPKIAKVSQQMDDSIDRDARADVLIQKISIEINDLSHIQKNHSKIIGEHAIKIDGLVEIATIVKTSKTFTRSIVWFITAIFSIVIGIFGVDAALDANTKRGIEKDNLELRRIQLQAEIDQEKKKDEYTKKKWEK